MPGSVRWPAGHVMMFSLGFSFIFCQQSELVVDFIIGLITSESAMYAHIHTIYPLFLSFKIEVPSRSVDACNVSSWAPDQTPRRCDPSRADPHLGAKTMAKTSAKRVLTFTNTLVKVDAARKRAVGYSRV